FLASDVAATEALNTVADSSGSDLKQAKRLVQMLRDMGNGIADPAAAGADSVNAAIEEQKTALKNSLQVSSDFVDRMQFVEGILGITKHDQTESLKDKPSGIYLQELSNGVKVLNRTGDAADGKSW